MASRSLTRWARNSTRMCTRPCSRFPIPDVPSGTIVQVMQSGFVIGDRVLRPALVGVAKGGPKTSSSDTQETDNASSLN